MLHILSKKNVVFGDILYKTFLILFLTLKNSQKSRSKVILVSAELNKAWDLPVNTVTGATGARVGLSAGTRRDCQVEAN